MPTGIKSLFGAVTVSLALLLLLGSPVHADSATTQPAGLTQIGLGAVKSLDALDAFTKQLGLTLPSYLSASSIESNFTFISKGGLATDKPIGVVICGGADLKPDQMIAFVFPMKPNACTIKSLKALGAKPMPDHPDSLFLGAAGLRRTTDYLIFSPTPEVAVTVSDSVIQDAVKSGDALVKVSANLKAFRQILPDAYKQMTDGIQADSDLALVGVPIVKTLDTLDRLDMGVSNGEQGMRLSFSGAPLTFPAFAPGNWPAMPATVMARIDLGVALGKSFPASHDLIENLKKIAMDNGPTGKPFNDDQKNLVASLFTRVSTLVVEPAAMSIGIEIAGGDPCISIVQRWTRPVNIADEVREMADTLNQLSKQTNPTSEFAFQQYITPDLGQVTRILALDGGKPAWAMDVVQKGNTVYMTLAPNIVGHLRRLINSKDELPVNGAMSLSIDLSKVIDELSKANNAPLAGMSPETVKTLLDLLHDQTLTLTGSSDGDTATLDITASKGLYQDAPKILAALTPGATPPVDPLHAAQAKTSARQLMAACISYQTDHKTWPDNLDAITEYVGGKDGVAKLRASSRTGNFVYRKPAPNPKNPDKTIVIYEGFSPDAPPPKVVVGYADGHVVSIEPTELEKQLGASAK